MYIKSHVRTYMLFISILGIILVIKKFTEVICNLHFQAERQAVNSTVQGSAADIVKLATNNIQRRLEEAFPGESTSHQHPSIRSGVMNLHYIGLLYLCIPYVLCECFISFFYWKVVDTELGLLVEHILYFSYMTNLSTK